MLFRSGIYKHAYVTKIESTPLKLLFLKCYMMAYNKDHVSLTEARNLKGAFPFDLELEMEDFAFENEFKLQKTGDEWVIKLRDLSCLK